MLQSVYTNTESENKLTSTAYTVEPLELTDGTIFNLRPLPIKTYRIARNKMIDIIENPEQFDGDEDKIMDAMFDLTVYCLKQIKRDWPEDYDFEDVLDRDTIYKVIAVCTDVDLKKSYESLESLDPETIQKLMEMQNQEKQSPGTKD